MKSVGGNFIVWRLQNTAQGSNFNHNFYYHAETSSVPKWLFPFAQAVCAKPAVSSFAAIWRPKSFTFSRGTAVGPELTCVVPDFPDVSVQIPQSCVPVNEDFCVTIKVYGTIKFYTCINPFHFPVLKVIRLAWGDCKKQGDKTKLLLEYSLYPHLLAIYSMNLVAILMEREILINNFMVNTGQLCMCLHVCEDACSNVLISSFGGFKLFVVLLSPNVLTDPGNSLF